METDLIPVLSEHERRLLPHGARQPGPLDGGHRVHHRAAAARTGRYLVKDLSSLTLTNITNEDHWPFL